MKKGMKILVRTTNEVGALLRYDKFTGWIDLKMEDGEVKPVHISNCKAIQ